ncbi:hypothetical protein I4641_19735 [Waterburya agarophytonicola K14]|uniref:Uncharacterized protein n=1 Tax=Waterburya agarophytonicola KI4 TaxID=2874699 RepID=A0A964BVS9_9CYAN|nr:hypothetical protein [Waterburya agarophytonicola]MCC0179198.1 hypothetical protein [Waterburya agarophytonicola KI4]
MIVVTLAHLTLPCKNTGLIFLPWRLFERKAVAGVPPVEAIEAVEFA